MITSRFLSKQSIVIIAILCLTFTQTTSLAQLTHFENIALPDLNPDVGIVDEGSLVADICYAQGMVFLYAIDKVIIYEGTGTYNFIKTVALTDGTQNDNEDYGKFSPLFFNTRIHADDVQLMTYNESANILYVLGTDLRIYGIKLYSDATSIVVEFVIDRPTDIDHLAPLHGLVNLKYSHNRLFCVIEGRNNTKPTGYYTGMFHYRDVYISIYNNPINENTQQIYGELYHLNYEQGDDYDDAIMDIEINDQTFSSGSTAYNIFYLARHGRVEIYKISGSTVEHLNMDINLDFYKVGKMLYINQNGINKLLVFPYRLPNEPTTTVSFYEIDGSDPLGSNWGITNHQADAPHKRILDAAFIPGQNDLVLAYSNDDLFNIPDADGTDIAIYSFDNNCFGDDPVQYLNTNSTSSTNSLSLNRPFKIHANDSYFLLSKKDEIKKVYFDIGDDKYLIDSPALLIGESNYYYSAARVNNTFFILNLARNGFEVLTNNNHIQSFRTGFHCLDIAHQPGDQKLFFYNKMNVYNNGLYIYDMPSGQVETFIDIENPIGDVVYNPFQNHMLISENAIGESGAKINVVEGNAISEDDSFSLGSGTKYAKQMFIAPNGRLYITTNMREETPRITILDASDYSILGSYPVSDIDLTDNYDIYNADFCYNPYNRKVYAILSTNNTTVPGTTGSTEFSSFDPYFPLLNSTHEYNSLDEIIYPAVLLEINDTGLTTLLETGTYPPDEFSGPREIICATPTNAPEGYEGKLYINADHLIIYDCKTNVVEETVDINFNDITYFPKQDMVFGFKDRAYYDPDNGEKPSWRVADVYSVDAGGTLSSVLYSYNCQLASIFSNPHNGLLYLQTKVDETRLGVVPMSLIEIDPFDPLFDPNPLTLENKSHYVELDQNGDLHYHNYNLTTPYIDPYQNRIYLPNGGHSNVSVVEFSANEPLLLNNNEYDWISIPRLNRENGDPSPNDVLYGHIFSEEYLPGSELRNLPPGAVDEVNSTYTGYLWPQVDLTNIYSTRGYKLRLLYEEPQEVKWLYMEGDVIDPETPIPLYGGKDNWVGYFLYKEQDIFDALGLTANHLFKIEAEDWCCIYQGPYRNPGTPNVSHGWECSDEVHNIDYGDMVVLTPDYLPANFTFTWQGNGLKIEGDQREETEHFTYTEAAEYTPIFVELDTTANPSELAAFVNDSCVGACIVLPEDTVVGIQAYLDGQPGDSITFSSWHNTKSTVNRKISNYSVFNSNKRCYEKRSIQTSEGQHFYKVSFRNKEIQEQSANNILNDIAIYPNPASDMVHIDFTLASEQYVNIVLRDIYGRIIDIIVDNEQMNENQVLSWNIKRNSASHIPTGVYIITINAGDETKTSKLIIN